MLVFKNMQNRYTN